jgi:TPP-dependent pyruvate/acetoin dehydrogenase alpha subunit
VLDESRLRQLDEQVNSAVEEAIEFAKASPEPRVEQLMDDIYG